MAQAMISQQKRMEADLDLDRIGSEIIELLGWGGRLKQQRADQLDRNFFQDSSNTQEKLLKKEKPTSAKARTRTRTNYSATKVKARTSLFLTSISYRAYKPKDFQNRAFVIDVYSFFLQNLNPLMTDRKFDNENDRSYVKMLWQKCVPHELCRYIYLKDNYLILTQLQITFQKAYAIIKDFIRHNNKHFDLLKECLTENAKIYQQLCATLYPRFYASGNGLLVRTTNP